MNRVGRPRVSFRLCIVHVFRSTDCGWLLDHRAGSLGSSPRKKDYGVWLEEHVRLAYKSCPERSGPRLMCLPIATDLRD